MFDKAVEKVVGKVAEKIGEGVGDVAKKAIKNGGERFFDNLEKKECIPKPEIEKRQEAGADFWKALEEKELPEYDDKTYMTDTGDNADADTDVGGETSDDTSGEVKTNIKCRNEDLAGKTHPETDVSFVEKTVDVEGKDVTVVVPEFDTEFEAQLPEDMYKDTDRQQFKECNEQLKEAVLSDDELKSKFSDEQLEQIENGDTPDGYTWHHDAESGKMQLVDTETHQKTAHTGGRNIWGSGTEGR